MEGLFSIPEDLLCCAMKELKGDEVSHFSALGKVHKRVLLVVTAACNRQVHVSYVLWLEIG